MANIKNSIHAEIKSWYLFHQKYDSSTMQLHNNEIVIQKKYVVWLTLVYFNLIKDEPKWKDKSL